MHGKGFASVSCPQRACFQQLYVRRREARKRFCEHQQKKRLCSPHFRHINFAKAGAGDSGRGPALPTCIGSSAIFAVESARSASLSCMLHGCHAHGAPLRL